TLSGTSFGVQSGSISAILAGGGAMTKSSSGTVILTGANTYSGGTAINGGILRVNGAGGTGSGDVNVNSTGTLAGNGSIAGNVFVNSGGHVAPGNSIDTISLATLTLGSGSVLDMELGAPTSSDRINVTTGSGLTLNGGEVDLTDTGGLDVGTYTLIDYSGTLLGSLSNLTLGPTPGGFVYSLVDNAGNTSIDLTVSE